MVSKAPINKEMKLVEKKQGGEGKKDEDEIEKEGKDTDYRGIIYNVAVI